jgi:hypothetical protein
MAKSYVIASGLIFAALLLAHAARLIEEGAGPLQEPAFAVTSLLSLVMATWAGLTLRHERS